MEASFTRKQTITPGLCDASGRLGCADAFRLFQDVASEHAERMGLGGIAMQKKHAFWMTVRTRVHFYKRPRMMPCFEGDALDVLRRRTDYGYEFGVRRPDGRYAALAQLRAEA